MDNLPSEKKSRIGNLSWRLILGPLLILIFGGLFYWDHLIGRQAPILFIVCLFLTVRGTWEMSQLFRTRSFYPRYSLCCMGAIIIVASTWLKPLGIGAPEASELSYLGPTMLAFSLVVMVLFLISAISFEEPGQSMETLSSEILIVVYIGVFLSMTAQLRWVAGAEAGYLVLGSLIIVTKGGDVGAYTLGRLLGRKKLSPKLSPGKTWWGARGAILFSAIFSWLWLTYMPGLFEASWKPCPWYLSILYGMVIGTVGLIGDLCESLIKRDVGKKDSSELMPGFGGILDVIDSILYTGPIAYLFWSLFPMASWR